MARAVGVELGGVSLSEFRFPRRGLTAALALLVPVLGGLLGASLDAVHAMPLVVQLVGCQRQRVGRHRDRRHCRPDFECPPVQVRTGASTLTSSANPAEPTAMNLRYQVTIGTTARECRMGPNNMVSIKVGMQGRVILGPEGGGPSSIDVPLRFAVVRETVESKVITTKLDRVAVTVPPNDSNVLFSPCHRGPGIPDAARRRYRLLRVYIGFDPASVQPEREEAGAEARSRPPKPPTG